jgi:GNAT superfamily N-acetyltransferase
MGVLHSEPGLPALYLLVLWSDSPEMRQHELVKAVDTSLWARERLHVVCWPGQGAVAVEQSGLLLTTLGLPDPHLNAAFVSRDALNANPMVRSACSFYHDRGHAFVLWVPEESPAAAAVLRASAAAGLTPVDVEVGMARLVAEQTIDAADRPATPLGFRVVDDAVTHADFLRVARGFDLDPGLLTHLFPPALFRAPGAQGLVAYRDRTPVAACWLLRTGAVAGLYGVVTAAEHRGRGYARQLLQHAVGLAGAWSCSVVVLQTARAGSVFERIGFRRVCRYTVLVGGGAERQR